MVLTSLFATAKSLPGFTEYYALMLDTVIGTMIVAALVVIIAAIMRSKELLWWTLLALSIGFACAAFLSLMQLIIGQSPNIKLAGIVFALMTGSVSIYAFWVFGGRNAPQEVLEDDDDEDDDEDDE
jgi:hypothetical protein